MLLFSKCVCFHLIYLLLFDGCVISADCITNCPLEDNKDTLDQPRLHIKITEGVLNLVEK